MLVGELNTKLITEKENEEPGDSPGHFSPNTLQGKWNQAQGLSDIAAPFNTGRSGAGGTRTTASASSPARPTPGSGMAAFTLSSKALYLFFFLVCLFLLSSHSRNRQGRESWLSVFNIIGLGCGV